MPVQSIKAILFKYPLSRKMLPKLRNSHYYLFKGNKLNTPDKIKTGASNDKVSWRLCYFFIDFNLLFRIMFLIYLIFPEKVGLLWDC